MQIEERTDERGRMASFADALAEHLAAIQDRDLPRLAATVSSRAVALVTAEGAVSTSPTRFHALHADWFRSKTWSLDTRVLHTHVGHDVASCLFELDYRDRKPDGTAIRARSILGLVFGLEDGRWVLIQDQNTPCAAG
jgi:ketosteroid isomerase-like protein